ncbi:MAG: two-component regulator propeller domain-containing protein [Bacteroidota bacterium]|nr:two-component regulator propeller domain-containing protein [Bacteroidota bacterium]
MKTFSFLLFLLSPILLLAQPFTIKKLGMEQGLSNSYIVGITQDREGYLWFATESGLNRFDGQSFRVYKKNTTPLTSINSNELNKVLADRYDNIVWIATQRTGLNAFNTKTGEFTYYTSDQPSPFNIVTNDITNLAQASDGNLWLSTYHFGVDYFDKKTKYFTHYNQSTVKGLVSNHVWCIADDGHGKLYIGHVFDGLSVLSIKERRVKNYKFKVNDPNSLPGTEVNCIYIDKRNHVWVGTNNGLALFNPQTEKFTVFRNIPGKANTLSSNRILSIREMPNDNLWIGTNQGGINILNLNAPLNPNDVSFRHIEVTEDENGLSHQSVKDIFQDSFNNIWIGTYGGGINVISSKNRFFNTWSYSPLRGAKNNLSNKVATGLCVDNEGKVWVGTDGGGIDLFENGTKTRHFGKETGDLPDNFIISALKDSKGNLWLGSGSGPLTKYDSGSRRFIPITAIKSDVSIRSLFEDKDKNIWVGTNLGLYVYNPSNGNVKYYTSSNSQLQDNVIISISQDAKGRMWIGALGQGLSIFTPDFKLLQSFNKNNGFCSNAITHLFRDSRNRMWVGTWEGLVLFNSLNNFHYKLFTEKEGMADSYVCAIAEGKPDQIWFSTNTGISQFNVRENKFVNYNSLDGIPRANFVPGTVTRTKNGMIYFGSQSGVCYFNSTQIHLNQKPAPANITDFCYFDKRVAQPENAVNLPVTDKIELKYYQNTFTISFNVLDYGMSEQTEYAYMLKGLENTWYNVGNEKKVTFRNIPPGRYEFRVKSRLRNQEWSDKITSVDIVINPPFWLTWWAKFIYFILIVLLAQYLVRFYKRKLDLENSLYLEQQNHQKEQELNDERLSFYTNIAHELRTPLTLIIGPLEDLSEDNTISQTHIKKISLIHRSATRLLNLINQILEFRKTETYNRNLCVVKGDLGAVIRDIELKYEGLNQNSNIKFRVSIETEETTLYYDPEIITIILDNLISNALKYTKQGEIAIFMRNVYEAEDLLTEIEVRDTGLGIAAEALGRIFDRYYQVKNEHHVSGSGIGLSLVKNLAEIHQGSISVESVAGEGSSFKFRLKTLNEYPEALHTEAAAKTPEQIEHQLENQKGLMLIVEDNAEIREYIANAFEDDFDIIEAENGKSGVEQAFERTPDIIISDIMMPIMDGLELCKILKEDVRTSHIPLILLTAKDSLQDKTEGYSTGADSYLTKPFSAALLQSRVNNLLEARRKIAASFASAPKQKQAIITESLNNLDKEFLDKFTDIVEKNLEAEQVNIAFVAEKMNMSHSTLYRKVKALTDMSANELVRKIKIQNAERLLLTGKYTISEVAFMVGMNSPTYFRQCFKEVYGQTPSDYLRNIKDAKN